MTPIAEFAMLSHGWRRALLMIAAGAIAALSAPPLFILPALFLALPVLVWALDGSEAGRGLWGRLFGPAFWAGFWFGLGYFVASLHWLGAAFFVDGGVMLLAMPFAIAGLAAILALFWGGGVALAHLFWSGGPLRLVALASGLSLAEFARGHLFTGFPFNLLGYALTANPEMMQAASLVGVYGLTFAAVLIASTPALVWPAAERPLVTRLLPLFAALGVIALQIGWGSYRINTTDVTPREDMVMRLVQPVVPQDVKWQVYARGDIVDRLLDLSTMRTDPLDEGLDDVTHLVWPEAALPFFLSDEPELLARIARALPDDVLLLAGVPRQPFAAGSDVAGEGKPYNAILALNGAGEVISSYDKTHLVPFGEYLPFESVLRGLGFSQFVTGSEGWAAGDARRAMSLPGTPAFLPLICYEAVYSGGLGDAVADARFILVLTNDAWFDGTIGPAQHFHHARLRAVEEGLALVRAANSGISAFVDPLGRIEAVLEAGEVGALKASPANPIARPLFARIGNWPFWIVLVAGLVLAGAGRFAERRHAGSGLGIA